MVNLFGLSHLDDKHRITNDNYKQDSFLVHSYSEIFKFNWTDKGLYAYCPSDSYVRSVSAGKSIYSPTRTEMGNMVTTLKENNKGYTQRKFYQSKISRKLY